MGNRERADKLANELIGTNYSVVDLITAALDEVERETIEKCAKITDKYYAPDHMYISGKIRALKTSSADNAAEKDRQG